MNTTTLSGGFLGELIATLKLLWQRPPRRQIAALCYRFDNGEPRILLITSRSAKRWILPKGWPISRRSASQTAEREAFEEAGIIGTAGKRPVGNFRSFKGLGNATDFPEVGERERVWLSLDEAIQRASEPGLRELLTSENVRDLLNK